MKIFAQTLIFNEENFIWFAIQSVVQYVDKVLVWDTGSTDRTVDIIRELIKKYPRKIEFKEVGKVDSDGVTKMRQKMLEESNCDWIIILDGDEIWPTVSIKKVVKTIYDKGKNLDAIVTPFYVLLGDVYHYQEEVAGQYQLVGRKGHLQVRSINCRIPGLHIEGTYPLEAFLDKENRPIQESNKLIYLADASYFHGTHLKRSSKRRHNKFKYEVGNEFPKNFKFPEVFSKEYPTSVQSPWIKRGLIYEILAFFKAPMILLKRRILKI